MAKENANGQLVGRIGNTTIYTVNGVTYAAAAHRKVTNPKTEAQMKQRIKLNNILGMYQGIKTFLQNNFEGLSGTKNASSFFRSHNLLQDAVWITKKQKTSAGYILAPYTVSYGRLPTVEYSFENGLYISNLKIADFQLDEDTEIKDFSNILINNNSGWKVGDKIKFLLLSQDTPADVNSMIEYPLGQSIEIQLDLDSNMKISDIQLLNRPSVLNTIKFVSRGACLGVETGTEGNHAFAICHTRGEGRTLLASSQKLLLGDMTVYDYFRGDEAMRAALKSYDTQGY